MDLKTAFFELAKLVGAGVVAALITNYFSARFSLNRFRQEEWWKQKRDAYHAIIRQITKMHFDAGSRYDFVQTGGQVGRTEPISGKSYDWSLEEVSASGAYLVTAVTVSELQRLISHLEEDWFGDSELDTARANFEFIQGVLATITAEAQRDLGVNGEWHPIKAVERWTTATWRKVWSKSSHSKQKKKSPA